MDHGEVLSGVSMRISLEKNAIPNIYFDEEKGLLCKNIEF
jgi:hypothetical protein